MGRWRQWTAGRQLGMAEIVRGGVCVCVCVLQCIITAHFSERHPLASSPY